LISSTLLTHLLTNKLITTRNTTNEIFQMIKTRPTAIALIIGSLGVPSFASEIADDFAVYDVFKPECLLTVADTNFNIRECKELAVFDLREVQEDKRASITAEHLGLGFNSPIVIAINPLDPNKEKIYTFDKYDENYIYSNILTENPAPLVRTRRSAIALTSPETTHEYQEGRLVRTIHRRFRTGYGTSDLIYTVSMYSQSPITSFGHREKYVDVTLNQGSGINFDTSYVAHNVEEIRKGISRFWFFTMAQYMDKVTQTVSIDNNRLTSGTSSMADWLPKRQQQQELDITKEKQTQVTLGIKRLPKSPIDSVSVNVSESIHIKSGSIATLDTSVSNTSLTVSYNNDRLGADAGEQGWCSLTSNGECMIKRADEEENPYDYRNKLDSVYKNGFRPDFTAQFVGTDDTKGTSVITVSTNARGIELLGHNRWVLGARYASGIRVDGKAYNLIDNQDSFTIDVNWDHPVYLGAQTVNLSALSRSDSEASCVTVKSNRKLSFEECGNNNINQSFIYSPSKQYILVSNPELCLDSSNNQLRLAPCEDYPSLTQRWQWTGTTQFDNDILYSNALGNQIHVIDTTTSNSIRMRSVSASEPIQNKHRFDSYNTHLF